MTAEKKQRQPPADALIHRAREGHKEAIESLCESVRPRLTAFIRRRMGSRAERWTTAEDVAQGVLIEIVRQLPELPEDANEDELWKRIHRTAGFRVKDALRRHQHDIGESARPAGTELPAGRRSSIGPVTRADDRRWLEALVAHLPPKYADVVRLCALEGRTSSDAARRLGLRDDTVRKRYELARKALNRKLRDRSDG